MHIVRMLLMRHDFLRQQKKDHIRQFVQIRIGDSARHVNDRQRDPFRRVVALYDENQDERFPDHHRIERCRL